MRVVVVPNVLFITDNPNGGYDIFLSLNGGETYKKIATIKDINKPITNPLGLQQNVDVGDYSDGTTAFVNYTPPATAEEGETRVVIDTGTPGGKRLYIYANGAWHYVDLS